MDADEQAALASLPPPPSAFPDFADDHPAPQEVSEDPSRPSKSSAASTARSMAARLAKGGRKVLSPLAHAKSKRETDETLLSSGLTSLASASSSIGSLLFTQSSQEEQDEGVLQENRKEVERAAAQQRMKVLEQLVQNRRADWTYLKAMHEGSNYWLNVALLREQQVMSYVGDRQSIRRGAQFFYLGIGLGRLVAESLHPELLAMDCCQLLEELEFYFSSSAVQGMKMMVATSSTLHEPLEENAPQYSADEPFRPTMHKWNQRPVYRRLMTPPIPFPLDYREVLLSLCDILALIYSKLIEDSVCAENVNLFQAILRFDERIKKMFIDPVKKEFSAVAAQVIAEEMRLVRKTYASGARDLSNDGAPGNGSTAESPSASVAETPDQSEAQDPGQP